MPMIVKFTDEQIKEMVRLHSEGKLIKEIAPLFNTSNSTVARRLREAGVVSRHPSITEERKQLAITYYEEYQLLDKVSKKLHMNSESIRTILKENGIKIRTMSEIKRTKKIKEHYFDEIDSHRKAYYLGLLYADGTVSPKNNVVAIALQEEDVDILKQFRQDLETDYKLSFFPRYEKNSKWKNQYMLSMTNTQIHDALISHGVIPQKSLKLTFPEDLDEKFYPSFLLGYMDGDGCILSNPKEKRCSLVSTEMFCLSVAKIIKEKLDVNCSISICHGKKHVTTRNLRISGGKQVKRFLDWIYSECDIHFERKYEIYKNLYLE